MKLISRKDSSVWLNWHSNDWGWISDMTHQIRTVKPEIRILGIDACRYGAIVGAIVRCGLYLDGILNFQGTISGQVSEQIQQSRYYPQRRVVMLHHPKGRLNIEQF